MMEIKFNEATRVQMPAMVHLNRLGYNYVGKIKEEQANSFYDPDTNILLEVFKRKFIEFNPNKAGQVEQILTELKQELDFDDLGKSFYTRLIQISPKLIDFETIENNEFSYTAEFTCKRDQDEFRPDITLFVNGLPLVFVEVKRPNNIGGIISESKRMNNERFLNKKFRRFINITQLMLFSNNKEYDTLGGIVPVEGAFYSTASKNKAFFNCFREENPGGDVIAPFIKDYPYKPIDVNLEKQILTDFNCTIIHKTPEYQTNLNINTPTNRILTSMCSPDRLLFLLKYGIAYVKMDKEVDGVIESIDEKHIMRYQQLFASLAIRDKILNGIESGVVWHTQGSGKTALAYYLNSVLSDSLAKQKKVAKFYFIVDRLDLMEQAKQEFEARGLDVKTADTRAELMKQFRTNQSQEGSTGKPEITVVNIQRFEEDKTKVNIKNYATNLQRIFIVDEAHRGYNPKGSFLANLFEADKNSIKIALTGTPLLKEERESWKVFGEYLHTYYYDKSIQDGYTLKILREPIATSWKEKLEEIYNQLEALVERKDVPKSSIVNHDSYVKELLKYIITDLKEFRYLHDDNSLGGMVICETSEQARKMFTYFNEIQEELNKDGNIKSSFKVGLILHDSDDKETRKQIVKDFKKNMTVDLLIVFNMLLTGFDAPRLKRLYFGRKLKDHNLLQAITRVNRPYKDNRYGYVIDFADIKQNFEETNAAYLKELNRFNDVNEIGLDAPIDIFNNVIEDKDEILRQMKEAQAVLFNYTTDNLEEFSTEISTIEDKEDLLKLKKVLVEIRDCINIVRTFGDEDLKEKFAKLDFTNVPQMISEVQHHINNINLKQMLSGEDDKKVLINEAMKDIEFKFTKLPEEELKIVDNGSEFKEKYKRVIDAFTNNIDQEDIDYITLKEAFIKRFKEKGFVPEDVDTLTKYRLNCQELDELLKKLNELQLRNKVLLNKYNGDAKFARVHKRVKEENERRVKERKNSILSNVDVDILTLLKKVKNDIDQKVYDRDDILKKDAYFEQTVMSIVSNSLDDMTLKTERDDRLFIQYRIAKQYLNQYNMQYMVA